jgi:hypothetical protein
VVGGEEYQGKAIEVFPLIVLSRIFPARPSAIPEIREFVRSALAESPMDAADAREVDRAVSHALLDAAGPIGRIQVSFRVFPDHMEVDVLHSKAEPEAFEYARPATFAQWMANLLERQGVSREAAAEQLGVSVKTVGRWIGGETEPRLRDLRRIQAKFGELPFP